MLEIKGFSCRYANSSQDILCNLSSDFESKGFTALVGPSGVGKSTLLSFMAGLFRAGDSLFSKCQGTILIDGRGPNTLKGARIVSWVPQEPSLLDHLTVVGNILLPLGVSQGRKKAVDESPNVRVAMDLLSSAGLMDQGNYRPRELSGGMSTRVSLLRALISKPKYLYLDEPFAALDIVTRWTIYRLLCKERRRDGFSTFLCTHDISEAALLADRILVFGGKSDHTTLSVIANSPLEIGSFGNGEALTTARQKAGVIERQFFA